MVEKPRKPPEQFPNPPQQAQKPEEQPVQKAPGQPGATLQRVDLPDLAETFADSIELVFFDGQTVRINFGVTRFEQPQQTGGARARRLPACRLVLTPGAAVELANQMQQLKARMIQSGVLKATPKMAPEKKPN